MRFYFKHNDRKYWVDVEEERVDYDSLGEPRIVMYRGTLSTDLGSYKEYPYLTKPQDAITNLLEWAKQAVDKQSKDDDVASELG